MVQDPAHPLSDTPASFTGVLVEPFEVAILSHTNPWTGRGGELDRLMGRVVLRTDCGHRVEAEMVPQFELTGDWQFAVDHRSISGRHAQLCEEHPRAMRALSAPGGWRRMVVGWGLWVLTVPAGTRVRVERFDAFAELRPPGDYRTAGSARVRVRSQRLVVIVDDRPVAPDALEPFRPPAQLGLTIPIALAVCPLLAIACASAGLVEVGRTLAYASPLAPGIGALFVAAFELDMRRLNRRALAQEKEPPSGPPKLC